MNYISAYCTDPGSIRRVNQDSLCIKSASAGDNEYILAAVCDGLGGLTDGETASAYIITELSGWFERALPLLLGEGRTVLQIRHSLDEFLHGAAGRINRYAEKTGRLPGTTMTLMLSLGCFGKIITAHVGDTRLYTVGESETELITSDHSVLFDEIRNGTLTEEEAANDSRQNQLTRCIGAGLDNIVFDYSILPARTDVTYLICSDGFRKKISRDEISEELRPGLITDDDTAEQKLRKLTDLCMERRENDNITAVAVKQKEKDGI